MITINYCGYQTHNPKYSTIFRPNGTNDYLFLLVLSPMEFLFTKEQKIEAATGACILFPPGTYQNYRAKKDFFNSYVHFSCPDGFVSGYSLPENQLFYPEFTDEINWLLKQLHQEFVTKLTGSEELSDLYIRQLLILLHRYNHNENIPVLQQKDLYLEMSNLRVQMIDSCEKEWRMDDFCEILNMGKSQFYKYYREFFNCSPKEELINARLQKATYLISNEAMSMKEAAFASGFQNITHFNRIFKKYYACSPSEYRSSNKLS